MASPKWVTVNIMGGLGNQLFQIFTTIAFSLKMGCDFFFLYEKKLPGPVVSRDTYWDGFLSNLGNHVIRNDAEYLKLTEQEVLMEEKGHHYTPLEFDYDIPDDITDLTVRLHGYFQSYKYFEEALPRIMKLTGIASQREKFALDCVAKSRPIGDISMHFRVGDYAQLQDSHPIMPREYYRNALRYMVEEGGVGVRASGAPIKVLYFCEAMDHNYVKEMYLAHLRPLFPQCEFIMADERLTDWQQMLYMSLCRNHIIGNSTFSLWGALLDPSPDAKTCYPWQWFTEQLMRRDGRQVNDMFPPTWKKIGWLFYDGRSYRI
jgi:hypothetical protein